MSQTQREPDRGSTTSTPRWVKVFGIITLVVVLVFIILLLIGGGSHGPSRHAPSRDASGDTPPSIRYENTGQSIYTAIMGDAATQQEHAGAMAYKDAWSDRDYLMQVPTKVKQR